MNVARQREFRRRGRGPVEKKSGYSVAGESTRGLPSDETDLGELHALADPPAWLEDRHRHAGSVAGGVLEEIEAVVWLIRAIDEQVQPAIAVKIHRQRKRPEPDAKIDRQARVVVFETLQSLGKNNQRHQEEAQNSERSIS